MKNPIKNLTKAIISLLLTAALLCSCSLEIPWDELEAPRSKLFVHFLDVGQGDSIFIELPNNETMLIDAAENYHGAGIIDYIEKEGHNRIDYLVATHPHNDHIGSMPYIVRNFDIGAVYMPKVAANTSLYESLLKSCKSRKLTVKNGKAGVNIVSGDDLSADIVAPSSIDETNLNNCSIVIKLTYGSRSFLLTGDAEKKELSAVKADISADVLKAGHHGSRTSTTKELLKRVDPDITVISCGKNNEYNHPHKEVLTALSEAGSTVYRTDKDKTVTVATDGSSLTVETGGRSIKRDNR